MQTLVSFLRGVNMAGHNKIKMADLLALYKNLGFEYAETYIQSGNVIFSCRNDIPLQALALGIEKEISRKFHFDIPVFIRTIAEMRKMVSINPFLNEKNFDPSKMAVVFLYEEPLTDQIDRVKNIDYPPDKFRIIGREIFIYCPNGFGKTKIYTGFFEKKMKVTGTGRNWNTINIIIGIAENR